MYIERILKKIDPEIEAILQKGLDLKPISCSDAALLFDVKNSELFSLLRVSNYAAESIHRSISTYIVNLNINFTNICKNSCSFCSFRKGETDIGAYTLAIDHILEKIDSKMKYGLSEVCIQGALNPSLNFSYIESMISRISEQFPTLHIHALSPMEIHYYAEKDNLTVEEVLRRAIDAGLGSICGTAAEVLDDSIRKKICPDKIDTDTWCTIIKKAHSLGLSSTATILYGYHDSSTARVAHMQKIKEIQRESKKFTEFIPLRYIPNSEKIKDVTLDLKMHAISRLFFLNSIQNIQVSYVKLSPALSAYILFCGANDLGGTLFEEHITSSARMLPSYTLSEPQIIDVIYSVGRTPYRRDTLYSHQDEVYFESDSCLKKARTRC